jgi:hypothetical protein
MRILRIHASVVALSFASIPSVAAAYDTNFPAFDSTPGTHDYVVNYNPYPAANPAAPTQAEYENGNADNDEVLVHLPSSWDGQAGAKVFDLVIGFHGHGMQAEDVKEYFSADLEAAASTPYPEQTNNGIIFVFPNSGDNLGIGQQKSWSHPDYIAGPGTGLTADSFSDVKRILTMRDQISANNNGKIRNTYVFAFSNGSTIVESLMCFHSDAFEGFGMSDHPIDEFFARECGKYGPASINNVGSVGWYLNQQMFGRLPMKFGDDAPGGGYRYIQPVFFVGGTHSHAYSDIGRLLDTGPLNSVGASMYDCRITHASVGLGLSGNCSITDDPLDVLDVDPIYFDSTDLLSYKLTAALPTPIFQSDLKSTFQVMKAKFNFSAGYHTARDWTGAVGVETVVPGGTSFAYGARAGCTQSKSLYQIDGSVPLAPENTKIVSWTYDAVNTSGALIGATGGMKFKYVEVSGGDHATPGRRASCANPARGRTRDFDSGSEFIEFMISAGGLQRTP